MSKLWASEVTKWGPLLFFQDRDRTFKMTCTCTHPDSSRLQGRPEIMTSLILRSGQTLPSGGVTFAQEKDPNLQNLSSFSLLKESCQAGMLWDWVELLGWNRIFSSSTLPSIQISKEQVLVTCEDMAGGGVPRRYLPHLAPKSAALFANDRLAFSIEIWWGLLRHSFRNSRPQDKVYMPERLLIPILIDLTFLQLPS